MNYTEIQDRHDAKLKEYEALLHLKRSVKMTRVNRIKAATRLLQTEDFSQGVNIYYSCFSAILSVFSLLTERKELSGIEKIEYWIFVTIKWLFRVFIIGFPIFITGIMIHQGAFDGIFG